MKKVSPCLVGLIRLLFFEMKLLFRLKLIFLTPYDPQYKQMSAYGHNKYTYIVLYRHIC